MAQQLHSDSTAIAGAVKRCITIAKRLHNNCIAIAQQWHSYSKAIAGAVKQ
jgi:hypothetical protein